MRVGNLRQVDTLVGQKRQIRASVVVVVVFVFSHLLLLPTSINKTDTSSICEVSFTHFLAKCRRLLRWPRIEQQQQ